MLSHLRLLLGTVAKLGGHASQEGSPATRDRAQCVKQLAMETI